MFRCYLPDTCGTKAYKVTALLEGQPVKMEIDTGAAVSLVSDAIYSEILSHLPLKPPDVVLKTYTGESVTMKGFPPRLPGVVCYLDDILVTGTDEESHLQHLDATLERLKEYGLRVCEDKCEFFQFSVEYLGHVIDASGLHTSPSKVKAIVDAPVPKNVSQLRSFLGLLNYYGRFIPNIAMLLKPLHKLLCHENNWKWTSECQESFIRAKETLLRSNALTHFDPALPIQLACDASPYGVGAVLSHIMPNGQERPIAFASRSLSKAEANYAQIEREALSIVFGVRKFYQYIFGRKFTLLTDHCPLTAIFGPHHGIPSLAASRMQRWALLLSAHTYDIKYWKSELHGNADGLSRLPLTDRVKEAQVAEIFYFSQVERAPATAAQVRKGTRNDPVLSKVMDMVMTGKGESDDLELKPYVSRRHELSVQSGCLLWGRRVIIPLALRKPVLKQLHVGHCGMVRMKEIARSYFWWPGVDGQIEEKARTCTSCQCIRNVPQLAPLHPWEYPEKPWHRIHVDFAGPVEEKMLLVVMDEHRKWPEVAIMKSTSAEKTIEKLGEIFSRFGSPVQLVSDNGPQFTSHEMATFLLANGVQHITSSPYHPATNGTPHATTKVSPAYLLFNRELRTSFELLKPATLTETVLRQQKSQVQRRNLRAKDRTFSTGSPVLARNYGSGPKWVPATVKAQTGPVSYKAVTSTEVQQQDTTQVQIRGAVPPNHTPPGITVVAHMGVEVPQQNYGVPSRSTFQHPSQGLQEGWVLHTAIRSISRNNSETPIPGLKAQGNNPLVYRGKLQHMAAELGGYKQAHPSPTPLTMRHSREEESPTSLKELGSRAQAVCGGKPDYL
ncbi:hypothetical protein QTP70_014114 [Hemibagrus guttatus]|uniref:Gypsy retrotransposon integrase-like protein 1 n=1 Tax=Hemibagrus guttatus TaxID=175788 RepID=A0AAE0QQ77_9TELE|nr:hypothetical protein QTP70_014114 [Hemibagrus guttatus]KAK3559795.1 hypothetical protein QTP86_020776 [Hemibagrus guttatus]